MPMPKFTINKPDLHALKTRLQNYWHHSLDYLLSAYHSPRCQFARERLYHYALLVRLDKPIGIFLLLWPTLWALWIAAAGTPKISVVIVILLGAITMRSAGCAINDFADRNIDPHVKRTQQRPLARGTVSPKEAFMVFAFLALVSFGLVLLLNPLAVKLACIGILLVLIYPFMKRYTFMPQAFLGITFGLGVPIAYAAQAGELSKITWLLYIITALWILAFDTVYAMVDREDDLRLGVKSTAILFGEADVIITTSIQGFVLLGLTLLGYQLQFSIWYFGGVLIATTLAGYQFFLIRNRQAAQCFKAFLSNNYFGMAIFIGILLHYGFAAAN